MMFRQEGDMGRYIAFNDPGQPGAGFSSLEEYLAAGNQMPQLPNREPLKAANSTPNPLFNISNANFNVSPPGTLNVTPPSVPISAQTPVGGPLATIERGDSMIPDNNAFAIGFGSGDSRDITSTLPNQGVGQDITGNNPIEIPVPSAATAPETGLFNRVGQQMIGYDDQFSGINDRLNKIEEGIASLVQNRGQGLNMNTGGIGYFFNPFGGFYG